MWKQLSKVLLLTIWSTSGLALEARFTTGPEVGFKLTQTVPDNGLCSALGADSGSIDLSINFAVGSNITSIVDLIKDPGPNILEFITPSENISCEFLLEAAGSVESFIAVNGNAVGVEKIVSSELNLVDTLEVYSPIATSIELPLSLSASLTSGATFCDFDNSEGIAEASLTGFLGDSVIDLRGESDVMNALPDVQGVQETATVSVSVQPGTNTIDFRVIGLISATSKGAYPGPLGLCALNNSVRLDSLAVGYFTGPNGSALPSQMTIKGTTTGIDYINPEQSVTPSDQPNPGPVTGLAECIDTPPFDDDWGWNGSLGESCRLSVSSVDNNTNAGSCVDTPPLDDDWGWNESLGESCRLSVSSLDTNSTSSDGNPVANVCGNIPVTICFTILGVHETPPENSTSYEEAIGNCLPVGRIDGRGWNGSQICTVNVVGLNAVENTDASGKCPVDVLFVMDTSGSMSDESAALCESIENIDASDQLADISIRKTVLGITGLGRCGSGAVTGLGVAVPGDDGGCGGILDNLESWGQAVSVAAQEFDWNSNSRRVIVPISDAGACDGGPRGLNSADLDSINNAKTIATQNDVTVSPIVGTGAAESIFRGALDLAYDTGGIASRTLDANFDMASNIVSAVADSCDTTRNLAPEIESVPETTVTRRFSYDVEAVDPNPRDIIKYSLEIAPGGMTIDEWTGEISFNRPDRNFSRPGGFRTFWPPEAAAVRVVATDQGGLTATQEFLVKPYLGATESYFSIPSSNYGDTCNGSTLTDKSFLDLYDQPTGTWQIFATNPVNCFQGHRFNSDSLLNLQLGLSTDIPLRGNIDGDSRADLVVWRPQEGLWFSRESSNTLVVDGRNQAYGLNAFDSLFEPVFWGNVEGDVPLLGDWDGDGKDDYIIYRPSNGQWWVREQDGGSEGPILLGEPNSIPFVADFNGDGIDDLGAYDPVTSDWTISTPFGETVYATFGDEDGRNVTPLPVDINNDGVSEIAYWNKQTGYWYAYDLIENRVIFKEQWGLPGDAPMFGDFDGDRTIDISVWRKGANPTWHVYYGKGDTGVWAIGNADDKLPEHRAFTLRGPYLMSVSPPSTN